MKYVLMVAEKPALAGSLAKILSNGKCTSRGSSPCPVYEWMGTFRDMPVTYKMTSVCGHVMMLDFPSKYNNWESCEPVDLFSLPVIKKESAPKNRICEFLAKEAKNCDYLVLWLDCDREGENICFEVINAVKKSLRRPVDHPDVVWRAQFSAITDKDVKSAMRNLGKPNENEAKSVDVRQEFDLRIGCAFTRFQTKYYQGKYGNLDSSLISFGPCQTPTLGFCVQRTEEIENFVPEPYWVLQIELTEKYEGVYLNYVNGRFHNKQTARSVFQKIRAITSIKVVSMKIDEKTRSRPIALNTVELMKVCSARLGMSPHHAMSIAERLYIQGYISYPRTETSAYPKNFDLGEVLKTLQENPEYANYAAQILKDGPNRPNKGKDVGDHPPITPIKCATRSILDEEGWKMYDFIARHFLATLSQDCRYVVCSTTFETSGEKFQCVDEIITNPGFKRIVDCSNKQVASSAPKFTFGQTVPVKKVDMLEKMTTAPDHLTESELITLMEKHGIGTDASIPVHINNITHRNYVTVTSSGRRLVPTVLGKALIRGYLKIDPDLVAPTMRAKLESRLTSIAKGEVAFEDVLRESVEQYLTKYNTFVKNVDKTQELFEKSFTKLIDSGSYLSRCGKCKRFMKHIQAKQPRLYCQPCNETYSLPANGVVRKHQESRCPLDGFDLLAYTTGAKGKSFLLCPHCYNQPPFENMKKGSSCNDCPNDDCQFSLFRTAIAHCYQCDNGTHYLDPSSCPKWKVICNNCDYLITLFPDAAKLSVERKSCPGCMAQLLKVEYKEGKSKLPDNKTSMVECIYCCKTWKSLIVERNAVSSRPAFKNAPGRGRGRGGRGRGRGGKRNVPKDKMSQLAGYFV